MTFENHNQIRLKPISLSKLTAKISLQKIASCTLLALFLLPAFSADAKETVAKPTFVIKGNERISEETIAEFLPPKSVKKNGKFSKTEIDETLKGCCIVAARKNSTPMQARRDLDFKFF